jgi:hypothetical protein
VISILINLDSPYDRDITNWKPHGTPFQSQGRQLVFKLPAGYADPEAANGIDIAMIEALRMRSDAPHGVATLLITDVQNVAKKRNLRTLTFLLPMGDNRGIAQAKSWGFEALQIMPEQGRMLAFFRKSLA